MKFLIDACAGKRLAEWLRQQGHDVDETRQRGPDPGDEATPKWAAGEGRVLITLDKDFGRLLFLDKAPHCGLVRLPDIPVAERIFLMDQILSRHAQDLSERAIVSVRNGRMRISKPN